MRSRALSLATVLFLIAFGASDGAFAQATNLEAGKRPSQIFAQTCNACHKSPRGLLKSVPAGSLPGFLRQHYTTSPDMAGVLASYLVSNGASDPRYQAKDGKDGKDKKDHKEKDATTNPAPGAAEHTGRRGRVQDAARPESEGAAPEGRKSKQSKHGKRGRPEPEEAPKADAPKGDAPKDMPAAAAPPVDEKSGDGKSESVKVEPSRDEARPDAAKAPEKPAEPAADKPATAKVEPGKSEAPALHPDPVPQVTPAAPAAAKPAESKPTESKPAESKPAEAASPQTEAPAAKAPEPPPAATAVAPSPPAPADSSSGPPAPPISR